MSFQFQRLRAITRVGFLSLAAAMLLWPAASMAAPDPERIAVSVDQAKLVKLPAGIATIVVGNPLIADVTLQNGGVVVVYRGVDRETYSCMPVCQRRITLGDGETYFKATMDQSGTMNKEATSSG